MHLIKCNQPPVGVRANWRAHGKRDGVLLAYRLSGTGASRTTCPAFVYLNRTAGCTRGSASLRLLLRNIIQFFPTDCGHIDAPRRTE